MKTTEVRRGNWIKHDNRLYQIDTISQEFPTLSTIDYGIGVVDWNNIKPIKLTEEILLKCSGTLMFDEVHFKGMCMQYFKGKLYYSAGEGIPLSKEIQYVHQLQNLYFVLTEKELKINL